MNNVLLDLLALGAILSGIMVITAKNPVISVLFLIAVFLNVAGYLVLLGVAYLGLVYLIVYVGAIAILFLFVIMMLNLRLVELVDTGQEYTKSLPMGAFLGSLFFFELLSILPVSYHDGGSLHVSLSIFNWLNTTLLGISNTDASLDSAGEGVHAAFNPVIADNTLTTFTQIESIGQGLYTYASLWLVVASVIFLLAMVGPIVLCMSPSVASAGVSKSSSQDNNNPLFIVLALVLLVLFILSSSDTIQYLWVAPLAIPSHEYYYRNLHLPRAIDNLRYRFQRKTVVYGILCRTSQMIYVGSTLVPVQRFHSHLITGQNSNPALQAAIAEYGLENFTVLIFKVVTLPKTTSSDNIKYLRELEQSYIDMFPSERLFNTVSAKSKP